MYGYSISFCFWQCQQGNLGDVRRPLISLFSVTLQLFLVKELARLLENSKVCSFSETRFLSDVLRQNYLTEASGTSGKGLWLRLF